MHLNATRYRDELTSYVLHMRNELYFFFHQRAVNCVGSIVKSYTKTVK